MRHNVLICYLQDISDPGSRGFCVELNGEKLEGFVVYKNGDVFAYLNSCPHTGAPLDWVEHQFLDMDKALIQCAVHDARFTIENGLCVSGPCPGGKLQKLPVTRKGNAIFLAI